MKFLGLMMLFPMMAMADAQSVDLTLKDTITNVAMDLNEKTVFCTERGYGTIQLKISVPDLDWLAHFDHRVVGERLPCITGGECTSQLEPGKIIIPGEPFAVVPMRVVLKQHLTLDHSSQTCTQYLVEKIESNIRGHGFTHVRASDAPTAMDYAKCVKLIQ